MRRLHRDGVERLVLALLTGKKGGGDRLGKFDPFILLTASRKQLSLDWVVQTPNGDHSIYLDSISHGEDSTYLSDMESKRVESNITMIEVHNRDVGELVRRTREQIKQTWTTKTNSVRRGGLKTALKVFDGLCQRDNDSEIAREIGVTRERVRQIKELLVKVKPMKDMERELRLMCGDERYERQNSKNVI